MAEMGRDGHRERRDRIGGKEGKRTAEVHTVQLWSDDEGSAPALPLTGCKTLEKLPYQTKPLSYWQNGDDNSASLLGLL